MRMTELPFRQPTSSGSAQWWDSVDRRNRIEGIFGDVKDDAAYNVARGRFRVMGPATVSLVSLSVTNGRPVARPTVSTGAWPRQDSNLRHTV